MDTAGKSLILRGILEEHKDQLQSYRRVWEKQGFLEQLSSFMDELRSYRIAPRELELVLQAKDLLWQGFSQKLEDIRLIYAAYLEALEKGWLDLPGELALLCERLTGWPLLEKMEFWLDGFHGFTPAEYQVIETLLRAGRPVTLTLNLPPGLEHSRMGEEEVFYPPWETCQDLCRLCREKGWELEAPLYLEEPAARRFLKNPFLGALEKVLAEREETLSLPPDQKSGALTKGTLTPLSFAWCANPAEEVERLAGEIIETARQGVRFREMAVLLREPQTYESLFHSIFPNYGIPYFFDSPKGLSCHPLAALLLNLTPFLEDRWHTVHLLAYLKTGLTGLTDNQGDALENYCLAYGVQKGHWESARPWCFTPAEDPAKEAKDQAADCLRRRLFQPLAALRRELRQACCLKEMLTALYRLLEELRVPRQLERLSQQALAAGEPELCSQHQRAWQEVMKLLDQTAAFLGDKPAEPRLLTGVLRAGLENLEIAAVPPALDQVTVSSMDRSRTPEMRFVWILGVNEGILPARTREEGLLLTEERKWLNRHGLTLAPDSQRKLFSESYLIYIAMTRAKEGLRLSASRSDGDGKSLGASPLIFKLKQLLPELSVQEEKQPPAELLCRPRPALRRLAAALQRGEGDSEETRLWTWLYRWFSGQEAWKTELEAVTKGWSLAPLGQRLPGELAQELFGRIIKTSITRLERFQACPFAHFLAYGLRLEPRQEYEVRPPEIGNFFHDSLEALLKEGQRQNRELSSLSSQELDAWVDQIVERQLTAKRHEIFLTSAWYRTLSLRLSRILHSVARAVAYQEGPGSFPALGDGGGFRRRGAGFPCSYPTGSGRRPGNSFAGAD